MHNILEYASTTSNLPVLSVSPISFVLLRRVRSGLSSFLPILLLSCKVFPAEIKFTRIVQMTPLTVFFLPRKALRPSYSFCTRLTCFLLWVALFYLGERLHGVCLQQVAIPRIAFFQLREDSPHLNTSFHALELIFI